MPSLQYLNQSAPFWDFIASMEERGTQHPFFGGNRGEGHEGGHPFAWGFGGRGPHHGPPHHHRHNSNGEGPSNRGPPPPPGPPDAERPSPPPPGPEGPDDNQHGPIPFHPHGPQHGPHHARARGGCHGRGGRGFGGRGRGRAGPLGFPFGGWFDGLMDEDNTKEGSQEDFKPNADVFDTESSFVVHVSLPGAKKEDVGVNWDAEKSELSVAGVIYRPGDEDFVKTLALDERKVGAFEKKVRLGSRANPAQVDADMITAKLEDGILRVDVPKLDKDYVEIKKVDIE